MATDRIEVTIADREPVAKILAQAVALSNSATEALAALRGEQPAIAERVLADALTDFRAVVLAQRVRHGKETR